MKCYECNEQMTVVKDKAYHYTSCGLHNVWIYGINQFQCPSCGEFYASIPKIKQLHKLIGINLSCQEERLAGQDIRFLRKELRLKAKDFASLLSIDPATLSRFENDRDLPSESMDKLIRMTYVAQLADEVSIDWKELLTRAAKEPPNTERQIKITPTEWLNKLMPSCCDDVFCCPA